MFYGVRDKHKTQVDALPCMAYMPEKSGCLTKAFFQGIVYSSHSQTVEHRPDLVHDERLMKPPPACL